jgi:hypothetical protein
MVYPGLIRFDAPGLGRRRRGLCTRRACRRRSRSRCRCLPTAAGCCSRRDPDHDRAMTCVGKGWGEDALSHPHDFWACIGTVRALWERRFRDVLARALIEVNRHAGMAANVLTLSHSFGQHDLSAPSTTPGARSSSNREISDCGESWSQISRASIMNTKSDWADLCVRFDRN